MAEGGDRRIFPSSSSKSATSHSGRSRVEVVQIERIAIAIPPRYYKPAVLNNLCTVM